jgi:Mn2+/Fe2+ NRAMP family transporter
MAESPAAGRATPRGVRVLRSRWARLALLASVVGPGIITANVDNDAGGIATYSQAGADFGYTLLWTLIPITFALVLVQEMTARMGVVTGKGLSDLIRERFGVKSTFFVMLALVIANLGNTVAEFAGVAGSLEIFGVPRWISVPAVAVLVWALVVKGTARIVERVFLAACVFYLSYVVAGFLAKPDWGEVARGTLIPTLSFTAPALTMVVTLVGTTIAPWMQFYLQAAVVEKGITAKEYAQSRVEVIFGCIVTDVVAFFIIVACAGAIWANGPRDIESATEAAQALRPFGQYAYLLFSAGLLNASVFAACILPLSTAYSVCEGLGFESGVDKRFGEAPIFYWLYTLLIVIGAAVVLIPGFPLVRMILFSQVINGVLLPIVLIFMILLANNRRIMMEWVNSRLYNLAAWITVVVMIGLSLALAGISVRNL